MRHQQLFLLFLCSMAPLIVGSSVMSMVPLYAAKLGADAAETGLFLAIAFAVLACSTLSSGWLAQRLQRHRISIVVAAILSAPVAFMMGQAQDVTQLTIFTSALWFLFGIIATTTAILTGLQAGDKNRGRIFGIIGVAGTVGQMIGSGFTGPVIEAHGFGVLFAINAFVYLGLALVATRLEDMRPPKRKRTTTRTTFSTADMTLMVLFTASILAFTVSHTSMMTRPLVMEMRHFSMTAITSIIALSNLVALPLPFIIGTISDRLGRYVTLMLCYALLGLGMLLFIPAFALWQFCVAQVLLNVVSSSTAVGSALITDLVPQDRLSTSLSRFNATIWVGAVIGFTSSGFIIEHLGLFTAIQIGAVIALLAALLVLVIRPAKVIAPMQPTAV